MTACDAIVIGVGGMGSAACERLAARGLRVLGLDRFDAPNDRGSSHGRTRICRKAYFEHPDYVPLCDRAYAGWERLETETRTHLFHRVGLLLSGPPDGAIINGARRAADRHGLDIPDLGPAELRAPRFAGFRFAPDDVVLFERDAGYLAVEQCVAAHVARARDHGAILHLDETARSWQASGSGVEVVTDRQRYHAGALVLTAGAWTAPLLRELRLPLTILRKVQLWFAPRGPQYALARGCPVFGMHVDGGFYYGFPEIDPGEVKVAEHSSRVIVENPDAIDRTLRPDDTSMLAGFLERHLPHLEPRVLRHSVCMYTMTPDEHFIIDRHPEHPQVAFAAGFSGHGFKFAPVVGTVLADLATEGRTDAPVSFLRLDRPALHRNAS